MLASFVFITFKCKDKFYSSKSLGCVSQFLQFPKIVINDSVRGQTPSNVRHWVLMTKIRNKLKHLGPRLKVQWQLIFDKNKSPIPCSVCQPVDYLHFFPPRRTVLYTLHSTAQSITLSIYTSKDLTISFSWFLWKLFQIYLKGTVARELV